MVPNGPWWHSRCNMCPDFFPGCCSSGHHYSHNVSILMCILYYAGMQNLIYGHGNVPQTTAESSDTPPIHCAQHVQQSIDMSIQLSSSLQCDPVQMGKLWQQVQDAWVIYRRMTFSTPLTVWIREYMPVLPPEGTTLCIDVTVWAPLSVTHVFHSVWICYHILLQW